MENKLFSRSGIRIINEKEVSPFLKQAFVDYAKWLRHHYEFPQRVVVYIKSSTYIKIDQDGYETSGSFFAPFDKQQEPYIKIATGDFLIMKVKEGVFQTLFSMLNTLSHEIQHYYQWLDDENLDEQTAEMGAEELTQEYLDFFVEEFLTKRFGKCFN
ncbi:hypothetical protein [Listeria sp. PSOL-1]|uniref:hypothetical protein n=1 Tax=Listeria sp. PSOL-1 TaxID=1844999 RepID=UPI0013D84524|nr:hypothetical protein [Listeria sp. PSOL-1]